MPEMGATTDAYLHWLVPLVAASGAGRVDVEKIHDADRWRASIGGVRIGDGPGPWPLYGFGDTGQAAIISLYKQLKRANKIAVVGTSEPDVAYYRWNVIGGGFERLNAGPAAAPASTPVCGTPSHHCPAAPSPTPSRQYKVMVARFPGNNSEHPASSGWVIENVLKMQKDPRISQIIPWRESDTPITMVRNKCVKAALDMGVDYLLMIDADMSPDLPGEKPFWDTAWEFMMSRRELESHSHPDGPWNPTLVSPATIAAPYCGPPPNELPYIFRWRKRETDNPNVDFKLEMFTREEAAIRSGIESVAALPTGLILYDVRLFKTLPPPWFRYEYTDNLEIAKATTEDVYQTRNAAILGFPQYVAWDCWAGHVKLKTVQKPTVLTSDVVSEQIREAVLNGHRSDEKVMIVGGEHRTNGADS